MPFNIGDSRELTNYKSTCMIMNEAAKKYNKGEYYSYRQILKANADDIIKSDREAARKRLEDFIEASIGKK